MKCAKLSQSHENDGPAWVPVAARMIATIANTTRMPTSMVDMIHCARAVICTPTSTQAAMMRNQIGADHGHERHVVLVSAEQGDRHRRRRAVRPRP